MFRFRMRLFGFLAVAALACPAAAAPATGPATHALVARATPVGWIGGARGLAWKGSDRSFHTGRAEGAAGAGAALVAAYDATGNPALLKEAEGAGDFLLAAQVPEGSGRWPTAYDPAGPAFAVSLSFGQGVPGIADFLWRLYERSGDARYAQAALAGMDWEASQFSAMKEHDSGLAHGIAGIAWAFNVFAERRAGVDPARSARYAAFAQTAASYLESRMVRTKLAHGGTIARISERAGGHGFAPGYADGAAGDAYIFYQLYLGTGRPQYRRDGDLLMAGLRTDAMVDGNCAGATWAAGSGADRTLHLAGIERGNAGIGWVALQAYRLLIDREPALAIKDLELARAAGDWLLSPCGKASRDGRAAGVASFLSDLYRATGSPSYGEGAAEARKALATARPRDDANLRDIAARLQGWPLDVPGGPRADR